MSDYITSAALKATLGISVATWDSDIAASVTAASRAIEQICERRFFADADANQTRVYSPTHPDVLEIDDLVTLTTLKSTDDGTTTYGNTWTSGVDFTLEPINAAVEKAEAWPYTRIRARRLGAYTFNTFFDSSVQVTGKFGWAAVPAAVTDATTLLAERLFKMKREAVLGIVNFQDVAMHIARADSNLMILVGPYAKHAVGVA